MDTPDVRTRGNKAVSFMPDLMPRYNLIQLLLGGMQGCIPSLRA
jgi:hypothetical protein